MLGTIISGSGTQQTTFSSSAVNVTVQQLLDSQQSNFSKIMWVIGVILTIFLGAIVYLQIKLTKEQKEKETLEIVEKAEKKIMSNLKDNFRIDELASYLSSVDKMDRAEEEKSDYYEYIAGRMDSGQERISNQSYLFIILIFESDRFAELLCFFFQFFIPEYLSNDIYPDVLFEELGELIINFTKKKKLDQYQKKNLKSLNDYLSSLNLDEFDDPEVVIRFRDEINKIINVKN